jgi:hypothetical protein
MKFAQPRLDFVAFLSFVADVAFTVRCMHILLASYTFASGLHTLVARSREDYCSLLHRLARNSEKVADKSLSSVANARQKLHATLKSHAVWNIDAQANTFLVRFSCEYFSIGRPPPAEPPHPPASQVALKILLETRQVSTSSHVLATRIATD